MAEDNTVIMTKAGKGQSTIFNTSVRGWIALGLSFGLTLLIALIVLAPYFGVKIDADVKSPIVTLFVASVSSAITHYFQQQSKEGQKL